MRLKCRAFLLVGVIGHGGPKFSLIANWFRCLSHFQTVGKSFHLSQTAPGVVHIFNTMFHAPSSHRTGKVVVLSIEIGEHEIDTKCTDIFESASEIAVRNDE